MSSTQQLVLSILTTHFLTSILALLAFASCVLFPIYRKISRTLLENRCYPEDRFPVACLPGRDPVESFNKEGIPTLLLGIEKFGYRPFQVKTPVGRRIVLPHRYTHEIKGGEPLSFSDAEAGEFRLDTPEFASLNALFKDGSLAPRVAMKLTQSLALVTGALSSETTIALRQNWPQSPTWTKVALEHTVEETIASVSSRAFIGKPLCRNERWLEILRSHVMDVFGSANLLKDAHWALREWKRWSDPRCRRLRQQYRDAAKMFKPVIEERRARLAKAREAGQKSLKQVDSLLWMLEVGKESETGVKDLVAAQLAVSIAALHTTTVTLAFMIMDLCLHPEFVEKLREEAVTALREEGAGDPKKAWQRKTLSKLHLMDACFKESQRLHPVSYVVMKRHCRQDFTLSDGTVLRKGTIFMMQPPYLDPKVYAEPSRFNPYRFMKEEGEKESMDWALATTRPEHLAFGFGKHACPGRFFASDEVKILLTHLLLKYDFDLADPRDREDPDRLFLTDRESATTLMRGYQIKVKRRQEEVDLDIEDDDDL